MIYFPRVARSSYGKILASNPNKSGQDSKIIRGSSNGRTWAFEAQYLGSNPGPRANPKWKSLVRQIGGRQRFSDLVWQPEKNAIEIAATLAIFLLMSSSNSFILPTLNLTKLGVKVNKDVDYEIPLSLYYVRKAGSVHGTGLFAARDIFQNEEIIKVIGPTVREEVADTLYNSYGIDVLVQIGLKKWILPNNEPRFINHSCQPNMGFKSAGVFCAMKDVKKGEELTYDYAMSEINENGYNWIVECTCGTKSCRKQITNLDIFNRKLKLAEKYKDYLPKFALREVKHHRNFLTPYIS